MTNLAIEMQCTQCQLSPVRAYYCADCSKKVRKQVVKVGTCHPDMCAFHILLHLSNVSGKVGALPHACLGHIPGAHMTHDIVFNCPTAVPNAHCETCACYTLSTTKHMGEANLTSIFETTKARLSMMFQLLLSMFVSLGPQAVLRIVASLHPPAAKGF